MLYAKMCATAFLAFSAVLLAGCGNNADQPRSDSPGASHTSALASESEGTHTLTSAQVDVSLSMEGAPQVSSDSNTIFVMVKVSNNGTATLDSKGKTPVNLGAHAVDSSGKVVQLDLARAHFAQPVPTGGTETVRISLPAGSLVGKSAEILPVQEGVAWFDTFGTKPLIVGPFESCGGDEPGRVCDSSGHPLAVMTQ